MIIKLLRIITNKQFINLSVYGFGQLFNLVTPLLVIPYIVTVCGEENFGKTAVGMALCFFLMVFIDYGSEIVVVKDVAVNRLYSVYCILIERKEVIFEWDGLCL